MNIFVPQSLQTQIELEEIAAVERQIITPTSSKTIVGIVQDGLLGAYNLTSPTVRIDWRNAMNIMSYTSLEDFSSIKKGKDYTGSQLYSLIVPPGINLNRGSLKIKNGQILEGRLSKDALGAGKKNNLVQLIWDAYGVEETRKFIDNTQRLVNNFNLWNGFSCGLGDADVPKSVYDEIDKMFQTKELKVEHIITDMENNPDFMKQELYEFRLFSELNIIRDDVSKLIMANLTAENSFNIMASSGSKGNATNMGQMSGCLGLQAFEGKIMPKKYNHRTLPYFHQHDDRAVSRGLVKQSFVRGLEFPEYVFHLMASRLGIIEQAIKSVAGDTAVIVQENGQTKDVNIGDWIDGLMKENKSKVVKEGEYDMESLQLQHEVYIPTCDDKGVTSWGKVTGITRHDPTKDMYKVTTYGGREAVIADSQTLLVWEETKKKFVKMTPMDAEIGDCIPVTANLPKAPIVQEYIDVCQLFPKDEKDESGKYLNLYGTDFRKAEKMYHEYPKDSEGKLKGTAFWKNNALDGEFFIPYSRAPLFKRALEKKADTDLIKDKYIYPYSGSRKHGLPVKFPLSRENGVFIGLYLADGNSDIESGYVQITKNEESVQQFVKKWFESNGVECKITKVNRGKKINKDGKLIQLKRSFTEIRGHSRMLGKFLTKLVGHLSENKFVPDVAYSAPKDFVEGLLDGYFSGDGTIDDSSISSGSVSQKLTEGINMLCNRLGMFTRLTKTQLKKNNLETENILPIHTLTIRGQWANIFKKTINLTHKEKDAKLSIMKPSDCYKNLDEQKDVVLDKIESITKLTKEEKKSYVKLYDLTVPSTSNFQIRNSVTFFDTAETGYAQRKLIKSMEDIMIKYDNTVRSANDGMIQFVYGDSGADTTKQYEYVVRMIEANNEEVAKKHKFTPQELKMFKGFTEKNNDDMYKIILSLRDMVRECVRRTKMSYITVTSSFMLPINLNRIIDTNVGNSKLQSKEELTPQYILEQIELLLTNAVTTIICMSKDERNNENSFKRRDEFLHKTVFRTALFDAMSPKKCIIDRQMNKAQFDAIVQDISTSFNKNIIEPGEMAGIIAAQSTGEPLTQMSTPGSTKVLIRNTKTLEMFYGKIGEFVDKLLDKNKKNIMTVKGNKHSVALNVDDFEIVSLNDDEQNKWIKISQVSRHPANGNLMTVKTKTGREVTTTKSHSHLKRLVNSIVPVLGSELKVGNRIPVAKKITECSNSLRFVKIGDKDIALNKDLGWLCGAYVADGLLNGSVVSISKIIPEYKTKIASVVKKIFNVETKVVSKEGEYGPSENSIFSHKEFAKFLESNFGSGSYGKKIPAFVFGSNLEFISGVVGGYFDGDGNVQADDKNNCSIRASSRCKELTEDISLLCTYFGINGSLLEEISVKIPDKVQYNFSIQKKCAQEFKDKIGLIVVSKKTALDKLIDFNNEDKKDNKNFNDMIPSIGETIAFIGKELKLPRQSRKYGRWKKKEAIGRDTLEKYVDTFEKAIEKSDEETKNKLFVKMNILKKAINSNVIWDEITEIIDVPDNLQYVYDFTVPMCETFMVNAGVLIHNTLNSFHHSGIATMSSQVNGFPRAKELMGVSKKPKSPAMLIYFTPEFAGSKDMAHKVASHIRHTTLGEVRGKISVYYDPNPTAKGGHMEKDNIKQVFNHHKGTRTGCQQDINGLPWLIRIELNREKMLEKEVNILEINSKFCSWWEKRFGDNKLMKKEEKKVINKITQLAVLSNTDNDKQPVVHIRFNVKDADKDKDKFDLSTINNFIAHVVDTFKLKGINGVSEIPAIQEEQYLHFNTETGTIDKRPQYVVYTTGVNMIDIRYLTGIDLNRTITNHVVEMYNVFGIEIARAVLLREFQNAYERAGGEVNYTHVSMIVDQMTATGQINSIDRHGMNKSDSDPLSRASFEKTVDQLLIAAVYGETDQMRGVSSRIMIGAVVKGGTGFPDLELDTEMIQKSEYVEGTNYTKKFTELNKGTIAEDIIKKKGGKASFVPM